MGGEDEPQTLDDEGFSPDISSALRVVNGAMA
jgi:hypothetical protein